MTDVGQPNSPADTAKLLRKILRSMSTCPSPHDTPPLLTSSLSNDEATSAPDQNLIEASAEYLLTLASKSEQLSTRSATQVSSPSSNHSPANPFSGNELDMPVAEARQE